MEDKAHQLTVSVKEVPFLSSAARRQSLGLRDFTRLSAVRSNFRKTTLQRFRGGLVFKAQGFLYHSTLGLKVIKKKRRKKRQETVSHQSVTRATHSVDYKGFGTPKSWGGVTKLRPHDALQSIVWLQVSGQKPSCSSSRVFHGKVTRWGTPM